MASKSGFSLDALKKIKNLDKVILKAVEKEYPQEIAKSAGKHLNKITGNLSSTKNWDTRTVGNTLVITSNAKIPYANIQEKGGKIKITDKMRKKMWALYAETKDDLYKAIALTKKKYIEIKAAKYVEKADFDINDSRILKIFFNNL